MTPTSFSNVARSLGGDYAVVRPDHLFQLIRESKGLPINPMVIDAGVADMGVADAGVADAAPESVPKDAAPDEGARDAGPPDTDDAGRGDAATPVRASDSGCGCDATVGSPTDAWMLVALALISAAVRGPRRGCRRPG